MDRGGGRSAKSVRRPVRRSSARGNGSAAVGPEVPSIQGCRLAAIFHQQQVSTASPQVLIESLKLASYLAFPNAQIVEFAVCQCVTKALVLQQENGDLGGAEG
jgi:hypothetical protein